MGASNLHGPRFRSPFGGQVRLGFSGSETSAASGIKIGIPFIGDDIS
jgi:hypothetical protein